MSPSGWFRIAVLIGIGLLLLALVRKWFRDHYMKEDEVPPTGFSLGDLRELYRRGEISAEEYERVKTKTVSATQEALARQAEERKKRAETKKSALKDLDVDAYRTDKSGS